MEGTDVYQYKDLDWGHDHSYYGNGCPNEWTDSSGESGSAHSCSTRVIKLYNYEELLNGTYFNYKGLTAGDQNGRDNANSPDSFCPLGWQVPYGGTGGDYYDKSKSLKYLLNTYGYGADQTGQEGIIKYPLSNTYAGYYHWNSGRLYYQEILSNLSTLTTNAGDKYYLSEIYSPDHFTQLSFKKALGSTIRCVNYFSIPHRRHDGRKSCRFKIKLR